MTADTVGAPTVRVSLIILNKNKELLLAKHKKGEREYWVLPGGHLEFGESIEECALRELKEETNLTGKFIKNVFLSESIAPNGSRHIINIYSLVEIISGEIQIMSDEDILCEVAYKPILKDSTLSFFPNIKEQILKGIEENWQNKNIQFVETPWE